MVTSCRQGETFGWADSLRHLLRGARDGLRRKPRGDASSDSEDEEGLRATASAEPRERPAWMTTSPW
eukprot:5917085-Alexandrium_andersonii.AAC.1